MIKSKEIVEIILKDLSDRRGFRHLLESIELEDPETYQEIISTLEEKVASYISENI